MVFKELIVFVSILIFFLSCNLNKNQNQKTYVYSVSKGDLSKFINKHKKVYIPKGLYNVDQIKIYTNNIKVLTDGVETILVQKTHKEIYPVILITSSNVSIGKIKIQGTKENDVKGEWNHAIAIIAEGNNIENVRINGLSANNICGDGVYVGSKDGVSTCRNIEIKNLNVFNVKRNAVSITSGQNISIVNVKAKNIGLIGVDLEMNSGIRLSLKNIYIAKCEIPSIGLIGTPQYPISNIVVENCIIDGKLLAIISDYPLRKNDGIIIRNLNMLKANKLQILNHKRSAIFCGKEKNDIVSEDIFFNDVYQNNIGCEIEYNSINVILGVRGFHMTRFNSEIICKNGIFILGSDLGKTFDIVLDDSKINGGTLARYCKLNANNISHNTKVTNLIGLFPGSIVENSKLNGRINSSYSNIKFKNCKLESTYKSSVNDRKRTIENL